jgi:hypothetical protein
MWYIYHSIRPHPVIWEVGSPDAPIADIVWMVEHPDHQLYRTLDELPRIMREGVDSEVTVSIEPSPRACLGYMVRSLHHPG